MPVSLSSQPLPLVEAEPGGDPAAWTTRNRDRLRSALIDSGAVLVRGLRIADVRTAATVFAAVSDTPTPETEPFAPRTRLADNVWSSTPWPAGQQMCMHHELSYTLTFPGTLAFACLAAAHDGGETGLADGAAVLADLPTDLVDRFQRDGWLLVRSYGDEIGASVEQVFGTADRSGVEAYCRGHGIEFDWQDDGRLRTVQRRSAVVHHPVTGTRSWFNQIAFLSEWTLDPDVREFLLDDYGPDGLPFTTRFGDGTPVDQETVELINAAYERNTVRHQWSTGDLLLVDNVRTAHSRQPYTGPRRVVVGLADPVALADCTPEFGGAA